MYLGIDLGTSSVKILMMEGDQTIIGSASAPLKVTRPQSGWSEQDPADWERACDSAFLQLKANFPKEMAGVRGIGFSGQMHGATLLDQSGKVLRPCMLWNDTRSHKEAAELDANAAFRTISGNIVFPGFTAPKLLWIKNHEPEVFAKIAKVLLPKDYLRFWLSGEFVSEMSDASGTSWLDVGKRQWSDELLASSGMRRGQMPELVEGSAVSGYLKNELAQKWGMGENIILAGGAGDNAASAIGMGTVEAGNAFVSLGTSGVVFAANDKYLPNPKSAVHAFCHALPDTWHQMGVILSATDSLNWLANLVNQPADKLANSLGSDLKPPGNVTFLPYLSGERTPHNDANIRGMFHGLEHASDQSALVQSVLEGVAFALKDNMQALEKAGTRLERVTAVGGGSRSLYWLKTIAATLNIPIDIPADGDFGAAFGAARLGLMAAENTSVAQTCKPPKINQTVLPDSSFASAFEHAHQRYQRLYAVNKNIQ